MTEPKKSEDDTILAALFLVVALAISGGLWSVLLVPNVYDNFVIGSVAGLFLGIAVAFAAYIASGSSRHGT